MNKNIILDVDGPLVDLGSMWYKWLCEVTNTSGIPNMIESSRSLPYDLRCYFKYELEEAGLTGREFFDKEDLYDKSIPIKDSQEALKSIVNRGYIVTPVSQVHWGHAKSKVNFLNRYFPFLESPIFVDSNNTKSHKAMVKGDYIIEDRYVEVSKFKKGNLKKAIIYNTKYIDPVPLKVPHIVVDNWQQIENYFEKERLSPNE